MASGRIEFIEHTADIGLLIQANAMPDLFELGAAGLYQLLGELTGRGERRDYRITLNAENVEYLFHDWLAEILYWFDVRETVFDEFQFTILNDRCLEAHLKGRKLDPDLCEIHTEVKAVTYHNLKIDRNQGQILATVIFDL